jgi:hypothetical protein
LIGSRTLFQGAASSIVLHDWPPPIIDEKSGN